MPARRGARVRVACRDARVARTYWPCVRPGGREITTTARASRQRSDGARPSRSSPRSRRQPDRDIRTIATGGRRDDVPDEVPGFGAPVRLVMPNGKLVEIKSFALSRCPRRIVASEERREVHPRDLPPGSCKAEADIRFPKDLRVIHPHLDHAVVEARRVEFYVLGEGVP